MDWLTSNMKIEVSVNMKTDQQKLSNLNSRKKRDYNKKPEPQGSMVQQ